MATKSRNAVGLPWPWGLLALLLTGVLTERADLGTPNRWLAAKTARSEVAFVALHHGDLAPEYVVTPRRTYSRYELDGEYYFFVDEKLVLQSPSPLPKLP